MPDVNANFIISTHSNITKGAKTAAKMKDTITGAIAACDPSGAAALTWVVDKVVSWLVAKLANMTGASRELDNMIISALITVEYFMRTKSAQKALFLSNHCSLCHMKGHNSQNCGGSTWVKFCKDHTTEAATVACEELGGQFEESSDCSIN